MVSGVPVNGLELPTAENYRDKVAEIRFVARLVNSPEVGRELLQLAYLFDRMAAYAETRTPCSAIETRDAWHSANGPSVTLGAEEEQACATRKPHSGFDFRHSPVSEKPITASPTVCFAGGRRIAAGRSRLWDKNFTSFSISTSIR
jgi:hypothetical protein